MNLKEKLYRNTVHLFPADLARRGPRARSADPCTESLLSSGAAAGGVKSSTLVAQGNQMQVLAASGFEWGTCTQLQAGNTKSLSDYYTVELKKTLVSCLSKWIDVLIPNKVDEMKYSIIHNAIVVVMEH